VFSVRAQCTSGYSARTGRPLCARARCGRAHATPGVVTGLQVRSADSLKRCCALNLGDNGRQIADDKEHAAVGPTVPTK
jgi:hypothetical protein